MAYVRGNYARAEALAFALERDRRGTDGDLSPPPDDYIAMKVGAR